MHDAYLKEAFPELAEIGNAELRRQVLELYSTAMERGGWERLDEIPFTLLIPDLRKNFVEHTRSVTRMALACADARGDLHRDLVVAGALTHDVGKLLEYTRRDGAVVKSDFGALVRHPVSGAALAMAVGLPDTVVHIIAAHAKEGEMVLRTPEAVLIHHCDFIDFEIEKSRRGMK